MTRTQAQRRRVTSLVLSTREETALRALAGFRYLSREQLQRMIFGRSDLKPLSQEIMTRRILSKLRTLGYVDVIQGQIAVTAPTYFATKPGDIFIGRPFTSPTSSPKGHHLVRHSLAMANAALAFMDASEGRLVKWLYDWQLPDMTHGELYPDGFLIFALGKVTREAFAEMDMGTERTDAFRKKLVKYVEYADARGWGNDPNFFPSILTITLTEYRAAALKKVAEGLRSDLEFCFTHLGALTEHGPTGRIWLTAGEREKQKIFE